MKIPSTEDRAHLLSASFAVLLLFFLGGFGLAHDFEHVTRESCGDCCGESTVPVTPPSPKSGVPGPVGECTAPRGLEPSDGYGSIAYHSDYASYVSATFDRSYQNPPQLLAWHFNIPSLTLTSVISGGNDTYGARFAANSYQVYSGASSPFSGQ